MPNVKAGIGWPGTQPTRERSFCEKVSLTWR
jgi:hypothetical protein